jgi:hypothetical protein
VLLVCKHAYIASAEPPMADPTATSVPSTPANMTTTKPALVPGTEISWHFPGLPPTLHSMVEGVAGESMATIYLPTDYTPNRKFPLAVFIGGAQGIPGHSAYFGREVLGDKGYICVGLPSYKQTIEPLKADNENYWNRMAIKPDDGPLIWRSYSVMLDKVFAEIPNIDREHAVFGGFSNGAHTATAILSSPDEAGAFLNRFRRYVLVEGGHRMNPAAPLTGTRFLLMRGGQNEKDIFAKLKPQLDEAGAKWDEFVMPGVGHEFSPQGIAEARKWVAEIP